MSTMVEFVVPDMATIPGLSEELRTWAGESVSLDPPRYRYQGLAFTLVPLARHIRASLSPSLRTVEHCLELDESLVLAWKRGALPEPSERALRAFAQAASAAGGQWAAVYDSSAGSISASNVDCAEVFERLASAVERARPSTGVEVLLVR